jgi:hypothetical protein
MRRMILVLFALLGASRDAAAANANGSGALALAALVAEQSPLVARAEKDIMARLLNGNLVLSLLANRAISIRADKVVCRASNVDISSHSCALTFATRTVNLQGRRAHELFATIYEVGVPPDGAAGTISEALSRLDCTIDPREIARKAGGGAACSFDAGAN